MIDQPIIDTEQRISFADRIRERLIPYLPYFVVLALIGIFAVVYFYHLILVSVHPGEAGVLYRRFQGGTQVDIVYPEGFYVIWPWNKMYVYNVRKQVVEHSFEVLTNSGLPIEVDLTVRFSPEYELLGYLHQQIGPDYVNVTVLPVLEATIRSLLGQYSADEVYTTKRAVVQKIINESLEQVSRKYVTIDDVLITKITLPESIRKAIELKQEEEQKFQAYEFINLREAKEAERKRIEAEGIRDYQAKIGETLTDQILLEKGIRATSELAKSNNTKVVVVGSGDKGLPLILGGNN